MTECDCCGSNSVSEIYAAQDVPVFQNMNFSTIEEAIDTLKGEIRLLSCANCGFSWNASFDQQKLLYDTRYQNEQGISTCFQNHLDFVKSLIKRSGFKEKKIIEIGCGKGNFLEQLAADGFSITGFDPAYVGDSPYIVKEYFSSQYKHLEAEAVILRHVLEHIPQPREFLTQIAAIVKPSCKLYIEIPDFEWIVERSAFWDIHYEHCNYFTEQSLRELFKDVETDLCFEDQYRYAIVSVQDLTELTHSVTASNISLEKMNDVRRGFSDNVTKYKSLLQKLPSLVLWGGGAKSASFINILDKEGLNIPCIIDINPKKQNKFIAGTGHKIISPENYDYKKYTDVMIMNENYEKEIRCLLPDNINILILK